MFPPLLKAKNDLTHMFENNAKPDNSLSKTTPTDSASALWLKIIGLAIVYLIAGKLSYFSVILPGYASAIWPASGIALAGILIYGYRIWPGVFLGAFLINALIPNLSDNLLESATSLLITLVISTGITLQAALGAYLVWRFADFPKAFFKGKKVFLFFFYGAVLSALLNSTLSVAILVATGRLLLSNALSSWAVCWTGDFLGVLIFTPLVLVWFIPSSRLLFNRRLVITLPVVILYILTSFSVFFVKQYSNEKVKTEFIEHAVAFEGSLKSSMTSHLNTLYSLERLFASKERVERSEFHNFVAHYLDEMPSIQALGWDPVIQDSDRGAFERSMQLQGYPGFKITEQDAQQKMIRALQRPFYLPIAFIEPKKDNNEAALGFDTYSQDIRRVVFDKARDSGAIAMTTPIALVQGDKGIVSVIPLYRNGSSPQSQAERHNALVGYVYVTFRPEDIVQQALKNINASGLSYRLSDEYASALIATNVGDKASKSPEEEKRFFWKRFSIDYQTSFPIGNRSWRLEVFPTKARLIGYGIHYAEMVLVLGLFLTGLVGAFIWVISGRESVINEYTQERLESLEKIEAQMHIALDLKDQLQKKQDMLNKLFLQIPGVVYQFKCTPEEIYSFPFISEGVNEIYELSVGQAMAGSEAVFDRIHPDDYKKVIESIEISRRTLQLWRQEYRVVLPDKGVCWLLGVARPEQLVDGSVLWHGFINDITERVQDEQELKKEKDKFHRLFELSPMGMALVDNETGRFLEVNQRVLEDTGYSKDEFLKLSFWDITPRDYQDQEAQQLCDLNENGHFGPNEKEYIRKDGTHYPITISGFKFIDANGKEVLWGFIEDISKRKQLATLVIEQALDKVQIAHLDRQRSLGLMSASLGHELKQPLTAILTNAQVAQRGIKKEVLTMPEVEAFLDKIIYNVKRTSHIIERIRGFIAPSTLEKTPVDIGMLLRNTATLLEHDLLLHNTAIQFFIEDRKMKVLADEVMLSQVFVNIYRNAIEAVADQKIKIIYTSVKVKDDRIVIVVRDTGLGLSSKVLKSIDEPFNTTKVGGLGVGLLISRSIIKQYDGQLLIGNAEKGGASIEIQLPQFLNEFCMNCTECDDK